jgi:hypothetical protein
MTPTQFVLAVEAILVAVVAAVVAFLGGAAHAALVGAGAPTWAALFVWAAPAGAVGQLASRWHPLAEARRWHGALVRRVDGLADELFGGDDEDDDAEGVEDAGREEG